MKTAFEGLLNDLEQMSKALPTDESGADDKKIEAAAEDGQEHKEPDGDEGEGGGEGDGDGDEAMGKSFSLTLEDGTEIDAIDGTLLVKSLIARVEGNEVSMVKALGQTLDVVKNQGAMIKSLQDEVKKLAGSGKGRKAVVTIAEKPGPTDLAKSDSDGINPSDFLAKSLTAQAAGRITGLDVAKIESRINSKLPIPADLINRVLQ